MAPKNKTSLRHKAAATTDILRPRSGNPRVPAKWKPYYDQLLRARNHLTARQDDQVKDAQEEQPSFGLHMAEAATDSFDRDLALSQASAENAVVQEIDAALERIRNGSYGICELSGKPIDAARLAAIPWTRFSLESEKMLEQQGAVPSARLSPSAAVTRSHNGGSDEPGTDEE